MARDYLPDPDADFDIWQRNFLDYAFAHMEELGLTADDLAGPAAARGQWNVSYPGQDAARTAFRSAIQRKNGDRATCEGVLRPLVHRLQASPAVRDDQRRAMGITVAGDHTAPAGPPTTRPKARIDASERFRHKLRFTDETTPGRHARPRGVAGCEIWGKVGAAPTDPVELTFLAFRSACSHIIEYTGADAGKTAWYMLRWVTTRGQKGPWSETG